MPDESQSKFVEQLANFLHLSCKTKLIAEANTNGIQTLADALADDIQAFYLKHGVAGHPEKVKTD